MDTEGSVAGSGKNDKSSPDLRTNALELMDLNHYSLWAYLRIERIGPFSLPSKFFIMDLIITTYHAEKAGGYNLPVNAVAIAFQMQNPDMENVRVHNNRLTAFREGYPVRFKVNGFTPNKHSELFAGKVQAVTCTLEALPVLQSEIV